MSDFCFCFSSVQNVIISVHGGTWLGTADAKSAWSWRRVPRRRTRYKRRHDRTRRNWPTLATTSVDTALDSGRVSVRKETAGQVRQEGARKKARTDPAWQCGEVTAAGPVGAFRKREQVESQLEGMPASGTGGKHQLESARGHVSVSTHVGKCNDKLWECRRM